MKDTEAKRIDLAAFDQDQEQEAATYVIDLSKDYPAPAYLLHINGVGVIPRGDIQAVKAKSKNGKSYLCTLFSAAILGCSDFGLRASGPGSVLYFDTEQNERNTARMAKRVHRLMGWHTNENREELRFYTLRKMMTADRLPYVEEETRQHQPAAVIVDGIADLCPSFNDEVSSDAAIQALMRLSAECNCAVICVLHTNKGTDDNNMKGHLGTLLLQKSSDVFMVQKSKDTFNVTLTESRNAGELAFSFQLDREGNPIPAENPEEKFLREASALFGAFFHHSFEEKGTAAELRKWVCQVFEASDRQADRIVAKAIEAEIIERRGRGIYALKRPPQPT